MIRPRIAVCSRARRLLPLALSAVLVTGCASQIALQPAAEPGNIVKRTFDYDTLAYWPAREGAVDDGILCVPESLLDAAGSTATGHADLWARVRSGYGFDGDVDAKRVQSYIDSFASRQRLIDTLEVRASPYLHYIVGELEKRNMPLEIALLPVIESGYDANAVSPAKAAGLWQFIPSTGAIFGLRQKGPYDARKDVVASTKVALDYLELLHKRFDGDWYLALAAYNTGEGNVQRAIERNRRQGKPTDYWSLPLSPQACDYVPRLIALSRVLESPEDHGIELAPLPDAASWVPVEVGAQIDLNRAAARAGISAKRLFAVNPAYKSGFTPSQTASSVLVPAVDHDRFLAAINRLSRESPITSSGERYRVRKGDTLLAIARLHETNVESLRVLNGLATEHIREGQWLSLPADAVLPQTRFATRETLALKEQGIYIVRSGDTLSAIAQRVGVPTSTLHRLNRLDRRATLRIGQQLRVRETGKEPSSPSRQRYTVRQGDSIARIAQRFGVSVKNLLAWNGIDPAHPLIRPGQTLVLQPQT